MTKWPNFLFEYDYQGETWCFELPAKNLDDAISRARAIQATARCKGEIGMVVKAPGVSIDGFVKFLRRLGGGQ